MTIVIKKDLSLLHTYYIYSKCVFAALKFFLLSFSLNAWLSNHCLSTSYWVNRTLMFLGEQVMPLVRHTFILERKEKENSSSAISYSPIPCSVYVPPYVIVYGGVKDPQANYSGSLTGSDDVWAWNVNGSWYNPQPIVQNTSGTLLPQVLFQALNLPSQGQILALVSNTTGGGYSGTLQVLDTTAWSWSFPPPRKSFLRFAFPWLVKYIISIYEKYINYHIPPIPYFFGVIFRSQC